MGGNRPWNIYSLAMAGIMRIASSGFEESHLLNVGPVRIWPGGEPGEGMCGYPMRGYPFERPSTRLDFVITIWRKRAQRQLSDVWLASKPTSLTPEKVERISSRLYRHGRRVWSHGPAERYNDKRYPRNISQGKQDLSLQDIIKKLQGWRGRYEGRSGMKDNKLILLKIEGMNEERDCYIYALYY